MNVNNMGRVGTFILISHDIKHYLCSALGTGR